MQKEIIMWVSVNKFECTYKSCQYVFHTVFAKEIVNSTGSASINKGNKPWIINVLIHSSKQHNLSYHDKSSNICISNHQQNNNNLKDDCLFLFHMNIFLAFCNVFSSTWGKLITCGECSFPQEWLGCWIHQVFFEEYPNLLMSIHITASPALVTSVSLSPFHISKHSIFHDSVHVIF